MPITFKTKDAKGGNTFGELRVTQRLNDYEFGVELWVMREGVNRNKWDYRNLEEHYLSFVGAPILVAYVNGGTKVGDGHNMREAKDPRTGETYYTFVDGTAERIVGTLSDDPKDLSVVMRNGQKWLRAKGRLFAFYARELVENIVRTGRMEVSAETFVSESSPNGDINVFTDWKGLGVTILGEGVAPAIPGARIEELAAMQAEFNSLKLKAAQFNGSDAPTMGSVEPPVTAAKSNKKGVKNLTVFNKTQLAMLAAKFEGYRILGAGQDDKGIHVCMLDKENRAVVYTMESLDATIVAEKFQTVAVNANFAFGEATVPVDLSDAVNDCVGEVVAANAELKAAKETAETKLNTALETIKTMQTAENARRVSAAKEKAASVLGAFNANRSEMIPDDVISSIVTDIESGVYTNSVDQNGVWIGESEVENKVLAACAKKVMDMDKAHAQKNRQQYAWGFGGNASNNPHDDGSIGALLDSLNTDE